MCVRCLWMRRRGAGGAKPHRSTRREVAELLSVDEVHLWPQLAEDVRTAPATDAELVQVYPNRSKVPPVSWSERQSNRASVISGLPSAACCPDVSRTTVVLC